MGFSQVLRRYSFGPAHYVFGLVLALRLVVLARFTASPSLLPLGGDMRFYDEWASRILHGQLTDHLAFYGLPFYAYWLALIYQVVGHSPFLPSLFQALAEAGTAAILYKIGDRVFSPAETRSDKLNCVAAVGFTNRGPIIGILAAVGWAFFVPAQAYAVILMPTALLVFVFWLVVWLIVRRDSPPGGPECLLLGLLIGFSAMAVATILFLLPLVFAALVIKWTIDNAQAVKATALGAALLFAGLAAGMSPCWIHNYFIARDPVLLSAHSGINLWIGNNPDANGYPKFPPGLRAGQTAMLQDSITHAEAVAGHSLKRAEVSAYWSRKAKCYIATHLGEWLKLIGLKVRNFWSAFQYDDLSVITNLREQGVSFPGVYFGVVAAFGLPGMLLACWRVPRSRWIAAGVLLQMAALLPVFVTERYRLAAVPGLFLLAAFGLATLWQAAATKAFRLVAVYLALLVTSTIAVASPQSDRSLWALDAYNCGWQALQSNNLLLAEQKLDLAYAYVPENAEINFALGNLRLAENDKTTAKRFYSATLRLDPRHEGAYNNLGILALDERNWRLAAKFFAEAVQQDPHDAKAYYLLAQAQFNAHDLQSASLAIARAIELNASQPQFRQLSEQLQRAQSASQP